jgi:hypothetical protein
MFSEPSFSNDGVKKLSTRDYFLYKTVHLRLIVEFEKAYNVGMVHGTQDVNLIHNELLVFLRKFVFLQIFHSTLFLCGPVHTQTHFTEASLTENFTNLVVIHKAA